MDRIDNIIRDYVFDEDSREECLKRVLASVVSAELYDELSQEYKDLLTKIEELEKEMALFLRVEEIGIRGSDRKCGHFVKSILSYCPVCREITDLKKKLKEAEEARKNISREEWQHLVNTKTITLEKKLSVALEALKSMGCSCECGLSWEEEHSEVCDINIAKQAIAEIEGK